MKAQKKIKTSRLLLIVIIVFLISLIAGFISVYFSNADLKEVIDNSIIEIIPSGTTDEDGEDEEIPDIVYPPSEEKVFVAVNLDNGTDILMYELDSGSIFNQPTTPIKQGWIFDTWSSTVAYAWGTPVIENMTITALYTKLYDVTLNYNEEFWEDDRAERIEEYTIIRNDVLLLPTLPTTEEYFVFDGWAEEGTVNIFNDQVQIQRDMVLKAKFRDTRPSTVNPILSYDSTTRIVTITNASEFESINLKVFNSTETQLYSLDIASFDFSSTSLTSGSYKATATTTDEWGRETTSTIMVNYVAPAEPEPTVNPVLNYDEETRIVTITNASEFESVTLKILNADNDQLYSINESTFDFSATSLTSRNYIVTATAIDELGRETTSTLNITYVKPNPAVNPVLNYNTETRIVMITNASEFESITLKILNASNEQLFITDSSSFNFSETNLEGGNYKAVTTAIDYWGRESTTVLNIVYARKEYKIVITQPPFGSTFNQHNTFSVFNQLNLVVDFRVVMTNLNTNVVHEFGRFTINSATLTSFFINDLAPGNYSFQFSFSINNTYCSELLTFELLSGEKISMGLAFQKT